MSIVPITPIATSIATPAQVGGVAAGATGNAAGGVQKMPFSDVIGDAMGSLNTSMISADHMAMRLAAGDNVDLHQVMATLETASIGLQTALQVRNKAVEAYREVMAMPL